MDAKQQRERTAESHQNQNQTNFLQNYKRTKVQNECVMKNQQTPSTMKKALASVHLKVWKNRDFLAAFWANVWGKCDGCSQAVDPTTLSVPLCVKRIWRPLFIVRGTVRRVRGSWPVKQYLAFQMERLEQTRHRQREAEDWIPPLWKNEGGSLSATGLSLAINVCLSVCMFHHEAGSKVL